MPMTELAFVGGGKLLVASHAVTAVHTAPGQTAGPSCTVYIGERSFRVAGTYEAVTAALYPKPVEQREETIDAFIAACINTDENGSVSARDLYEAYDEWCDANAELALYRPQFVGEMQKRGHRATGAPVRQYNGIELASPSRRKGVR